MWAWIALAGGAAWAAYAAAWPGAQAWGRGFHRGPAWTGAAALTFDDGPSGWTPAILELLAKHEARATFFVCGSNAGRLPHILRETVAAGHELGNHTHTHPRLIALTPKQICGEISRAQRAIAEHSGVTPRLFRPPYGVRAPGLRGALEREGLTCVHWTVAGNDWKWPADKIAPRVLRRTAAGGIVCLHDGHETRATADRRETARALETILPELRSRGLRFVTAGEMLTALQTGREAEHA